MNFWHRLLFRLFWKRNMPLYHLLNIYVEARALTHHCKYGGTPESRTGMMLLKGLEVAVEEFEQK